MHILAIGAKGMLGRELVALLDGGVHPAALRSQFAEWQPKQACWTDAKDLIPVRLSAMDVDELDITRRDDVLRVIGEIRPALVINAAAYTDVDGCESHEAEAAAVNANGPAHLAEACREYNSRLVHVSTDYVFDGKGTAPYPPEYPVSPQSAYGRTKAAGESEIRRILPNGHAIVRTSWLFGVHGKNFVKTIRKLASERSELRVVTDQVGCPTNARDLAAALIVLGLGGTTGTHHFCNAGVCSWNEFATEIVRRSGANCRVLPQTTAELNRPAARPAYSALSTASLTAETGIVPRHWTDALADCLTEL
ncbi:MAG TPA: dTDP-4-dehydrorhamnose reductase [Phycisphaerae bacterium]|nr:dTDP-4-dehydrorhamnose reductase [Phycisphaerae bacterium]HOJ74577.1 dTDP-4-dehydrorhamnose reductase [Phycisphaerae bacterium]HOM50476.1 dTDP-4-dehydrorhamnose reductase [Phycisphaerae bacterium]HOQ87581.1 dTDP-4-dehydrorhamnose reductase [Phycisphaerae bacterium]HPP28249.1 dTDP-4-dehydrorhamnose reductase [Phycisphaerae bacterium]